MPHGIGRHVEPERLQTRTYLHQVHDEEAFGATDVENPVARPQSEMPDDVLGDGNPATVVAIAAITLLACAVEILHSKLHRSRTVLRLVSKACFHIAGCLRIA